MNPALKEFISVWNKARGDDRIPRRYKLDLIRLGDVSGYLATVDLQGAEPSLAYVGSDASTGFTRDPLGDPVDKVFSAEIAANVRLDFIAQKKTGRCMMGRVGYRSKKGKAVNMDFVALPLMNGAGEVVLSIVLGMLPADKTNINDFPLLAMANHWQSRAFDV